MLIVEDFYELNALVRTLWHAKFYQNPEDCSIIASSRLVAEVFARAYDALIEAARARHDKATASNWERSRRVTPDLVAATLSNGVTISSRESMALAMTRTRIKLYPNLWNSWDLNHKRSYVKTLLSPYQAADDFLDELVLEGDHANAEV